MNAMRLLDQVPPPASGRIQPYLSARKSGVRIRLMPRDNVVVYSAADLLARTLSGDNSYIPKHIGFIYGTAESPALDDPDSLPANLKRAHDWSKIATDTAAINGNILIAPLAIATSIAVDGDAAKYAGNAATFSAHTGLVQEYAFSTTGGTFAPPLEELDKDYAQSAYIYHAILLNRWQSGSSITYTPFSRAALETAPFTPKPAAFDLGVYWTISFK
jgi:hypothetical protein